MPSAVEPAQFAVAGSSWPAVADVEESSVVRPVRLWAAGQVSAVVAGMRGRLDCRGSADMMPVSSMVLVWAPHAGVPSHAEQVALLGVREDYRRTGGFPVDSDHETRLRASAGARLAPMEILLGGRFGRRGRVQNFWPEMSEGVVTPYPLWPYEDA